MGIDPLTIATPLGIHPQRYDTEQDVDPDAVSIVDRRWTISGVVWFLAVVCLNFTGGPRLELPVAIVSGILVMFFTFLLLAAS